MKAGGLCRVAVAGFLLAYLAALGLLLVGTLGLFGNERDPLAGVFLIPLGIPWIWLVDGVAEPLRPWLAAASPAVNLALLWFICGKLGSRRRKAA